MRIRDHFSFTNSERKGTIALTAIIILLLAIISIQRYYFYHSSREIQFSETWNFSADSLAFNNDSAADDIQQKELAENAVPHSIYHKKELFLFDPNGLAEEDWVKLGLSPAQARVVKNYESKGGKFYSKADVKKMFVISDAFYREIEPYIVLPDKTEGDAANYASHPKPVAPKKVIIVELNSADSALLVSLKGIGPGFASRILAYREKLGGYHSVDQLKEVFGMLPETVDSIRKSVTVDTTFIHKININTCDAKELKFHPYMNYSIANALINYRKAHGPFSKLPDIRNCALVNADLYRKIAPYLTL